MKKGAGRRPSRKRSATAAGRRKPAQATTGASRPEHRWTFLSNHAHVLICLARDPDQRLRDVADQIGITERSVQSIVSDLEAEGILARRREGRRNTYELRLGHPLRHPVERHRTVGELVGLIVDG